MQRVTPPTHLDQVTVGEGIPPVTRHWKRALAPGCIVSCSWGNNSITGAWRPGSTKHGTLQSYLPGCLLGTLHSHLSGCLLGGVYVPSIHRMPGGTIVGDSDL